MRADGGLQEMVIGGVMDGTVETGGTGTTVGGSSWLTDVAENGASLVNTARACNSSVAFCNCLATAAAVCTT